MILMVMALQGIFDPPPKPIDPVALDAFTRALARCYIDHTSEDTARDVMGIYRKDRASDAADRYGAALSTIASPCRQLFSEWRARVPGANPALASMNLAKQEWLRRDPGLYGVKFVSVSGFRFAVPEDAVERETSPAPHRVRSWSWDGGSMTGRWVVEEHASASQARSAAQIIAAAHPSKPPETMPVTGTPIVRYAPRQYGGVYCGAAAARGNLSIWVEIQSKDGVQYCTMKAQLLVDSVAVAP